MLFFGSPGWGALKKFCNGSLGISQLAPDHHMTVMRAILKKFCTGHKAPQDLRLELFVLFRSLTEAVQPSGNIFRADGFFFFCFGILYALLDACAPPLCVDKHIPRCVRNDAGSNGTADVVDFCIHRGQLIQQAQLFGARCCRFSR